MTDTDALLRAVLAAPDDDAPRLVYADWLDENAEALPAVEARAEWARAEFIRLQCKVARLIVPDHRIVTTEGPVIRLAIALEAHLPAVENGVGADFSPECMSRGQNEIFRHEPTRAKAGVLILHLRDVRIQLGQIIGHC